jgi:hypothetical protein
MYMYRFLKCCSNKRVLISITMLEEDGVVGASRESERFAKKNRWHVKYCFIHKERGLFLSFSKNCTSITELCTSKQF